jgi:predicted transcriptional regulator
VPQILKKTEKMKLGGVERMHKIEQLPDCELQIMKIIWENVPRISQTEIRKQMQEKNNRDYGRTTISTWLSRMKKKKFVSSVIERGISYYSPLVSEEDYKKAEMKKFMEFWFENSPAKFMKLFVSCETISEEDAKEIKEILG